MASPPAKLGAVKLRLTCALPGLTLSSVGAAAGTAWMAKLCGTGVAAANAALPAWRASMVQVPVLVEVSSPTGVMVHTVGVKLVKLNGSEIKKPRAAR